MAFAIAEGIRADNPCNGVELPKGPKSMGHKTWLEPQVAQYRDFARTTATSAPSPCSVTTSAKY